ncbi:MULTISPECIES: hypothetical protein [unclassified Rhizobium]|uniref:hypothetical protein n=1 Tax=unclassified Rhizobium TaxID=2613769 RepID=UPI000B52ADC3|nr:MULTISPECIES: hypothetical protein [unclassified Rhizobium]
MSSDDDKIETYGIDPPYAEAAGIERAEKRRWLIWGVAIAGLTVFMIALLSYLVWPPTLRTDASTTASTRTQPIPPSPALPPDASATTIDRSPSPSGSGGGPTGVTSPTGTEKVK